MGFIAHRLSYVSLLAAGCFCAAPGFGQAPNIGNCGVLPANNIWNTPVDQLPVSGSSSTWVNTIGAGSPLHPDFGAALWNGGPIGIPFITVPGTQTKYPAIFTYADESDAGPYAVPLNAPIEGGSASSGDRHAIAIDTDNCVMREAARFLAANNARRGNRFTSPARLDPHPTVWH